MTDLKPCPFCGGKAELYTQRVIGGIDYVHIICKTCRVSTVDYEASTSYCANDKAIEDWNRRAETVKDQPDGDVVEVRHGKWIQESFELFKCSECGYLTDYRLSNFCPDCGAKMDGKVGADND